MHSDPRYSLVGYSISQYDLYEQNGIFELLEELPLAGKYLNYEQMAIEYFKMWARPTINWDLSKKCGSNPPLTAVNSIEDSFP